MQTSKKNKPFCPQLRINLSTHVNNNDHLSYKQNGNKPKQWNWTKSIDHQINYKKEIVCSECVWSGGKTGRKQIGFSDVFVWFVGACLYGILAIYSKVTKSGAFVLSRTTHRLQSLLGFRTNLTFSCQYTETHFDFIIQTNAKNWQTNLLFIREVLCLV